MASKKILIITPKFPLPDIGACEKDRLEGMVQLKRLGHDVQVIAKVFEFQDRGPITEFSKKHNIPIHLVPYERQKSKTILQTVWFYFKRLMYPPYWDGAAYEYSHASIQDKVQEMCENWKPDVVWIEYTYLWPVYHIPRSRTIPIITRSINFEPEHFLEEDGRTVINYIKYVPKLWSEYLAVVKSEVMLSITPKEEKKYKRWGGKYVRNLPLRGLPLYLKQGHQIRDQRPLKVFFMGSTYNVAHNRKAAEFVLKEIAPKVHEQYPGEFEFYILGKKLPKDLEPYVKDNVQYVGYQNTKTYLLDMDIALIPSLYGAGMQQKIFEPLTMGIPTLTSRRGMADYPFEQGVNVFFAKEADEFVTALADMRNLELRKKLSANSIKITQEMFSQKAIDDIVENAIQDIL